MRIKHYLDPHDLQDFISRLLKERSLSLGTLSKLIGVTYSTLSAYATSIETDFMPSVRNLGKIAEYLDISSGTLLTLIENRSPLPQVSSSGRNLLEDLASDKLDIDGLIETLEQDSIELLAKAQINLSRIQLKLLSSTPHN